MQHSIRTSGTIAFLSSVVALGLGVPAWASGDAVTGTIEAWPHDRADIATGLMEPRVIGRVDADGTVHIPLPPDFTQTTIEATEAQNAGDSGWSVTMKTAGEAWGCESGGLEVENGDKYAVNLSTLGIFMISDIEKELLHGILMVTSSREFAEGYDPFAGPPSPGWYMDWVHADTDIRIIGECEETPLTLPETELQAVTDYSIELSPGWNLLKFEIEEVYEDESGRVWPTKSSYRTIDELPDAAEFMFVPDPDS